jgi:hypothetical protein
MKINLYIILLLSLFAASCINLEETLESNQSTNQFYKNGDDATSAVNAIYAGLSSSGQTLYNSLFQIGMEMATDDYEAGPRARNAHVRAISILNHDASNDRMQQLWLQSYALISQANIAIDRIALIDDNNITPELRNRTINEAKFLRALSYFNLVRWFGAIPLALHEKDNLYPENKPVEVIYEQIIQDLTDAEALPAADEYASNDIGRATSGAAKSLLAKVYLTKKDWPNARIKSHEVILSEKYDLFENFADVFNVAAKNGKEHIFSAQFKGYANFVGNSLASRTAPTNDEVPGVNGDYADALHVEGGLFESFSDSDKRKAVTFITEMVSPSDGKTYTLNVPHFHKYYDLSAVGSQGNSSKNTPIIRYAEVLLIYAEALNEENNGPDSEGKAYRAIDKVRERAGIPKLADIAPNLTVEQLRDTIFQERRKELVYEYQRWFDLVRRGAEYYIKILHAAGKTNAAPRHIYFPIPQRELDINPNLRQNPLWLNYN